MLFVSSAVAARAPRKALGCTSAANNSLTSPGKKGMYQQDNMYFSRNALEIISFASRNYPQKAGHRLKSHYFCPKREYFGLHEVWSAASCIKCCVSFQCRFLTLTGNYFQQGPFDMVKYVIMFIDQLMMIKL